MSNLIKFLLYCITLLVLKEVIYKILILTVSENTLYIITKMVIIFLQYHIIERNNLKLN